MATKTIPVRDVSKLKNSPVMLMLREYRNAIKEKGGVRAFLDKFGAPDDEFSADLLHRHVRMTKQELVNYLEMLSYDMRKDKYYHAYVEFVGERTKPFISKLESGPRQLCVTYAYNAYEYGIIFMWYDLQGTFMRYVFIPHINEETNKIDKCTILLDVEIYNYQVIEPPAIWMWDEQEQKKEENHIINHVAYGLKRPKYVWYVCYGSNLCYERFMSYITGRACEKYGVKAGEPCKDQTEPIKSRLEMIPYKIYLSGYSTIWDGAPAYLSPNKDKNSRTFARAYLISEEQYEHVKKREGSSYSHEIELDPIDGIRAVTFTNARQLQKEHRFSERYRLVMFNGLKEIGLTDKIINKYLDNIIK